MKLAVIDCGTNTFNLLILALTAEDKYERIFHTRVAVKLGGRSMREGAIVREAFDRAVDAIQLFNEIIRANKCDKVLAYATSAIRDASNGPDFTRLIAKRYNIAIDVIDGETEAGLIYKGVRGAVKLGDEKVLIMDIGGGSTEFIIANGSQIFWKHSFNIGAARMLEKFSPSDPVTDEEVTAMHKHLEAELRELFTVMEEHKPTGFVGSSGAFESLIEMIHEEMHGEPFTSKTEYTIAIPDYRAISQKIRRSTLAERRAMRGLVPMRVDMIVVFCLKVDFILERYKFDPIRVSAFSLKEGAAIEFIENHTKH